MGDIALYVALTLVLMWTVRMARSKGKNPWLWGGLAFILMVIPSLKLLSVIPIIFLMFMKGSPNPGGSINQASVCPRCQAPFLRNSRFCTSCGWDLAERYYPEPVREERGPVAAQAVEDREPVDVAAPPPRRPMDEPPPAPAEPAPPPFTPPKKPVTLVLPTAAGMTERGVSLFNQGRIQESIDQFTKAIALDPNYVEAWARRAEAYAQLGRGNEAAEDRRRLDALDTG